MANSMMPQDFTRCIELLQVSPHLRTHSQLQILADSFRSSSLLSANSSLTSTNVVQFCKRILYAEFLPEAFVINKGEVGTEVFFILEGSVRVLSLQSVNKKQGLLKSRTTITEDLALVEVAVLSQGNSFGEMAVINDKLRNASVQCITPVKLAVIPKAAYEEISESSNKLYQEKVSFLKKIPFFKFWTKTSLQKLVLSLEKHSFKRGKVIYREGSQPNRVYIIQQGEVSFSCLYRFIKETENGECVNAKFNRVRQRSLVSCKDLQICIKTPLKMFGFEEIVNEVPYRQSTAVAYTDVELYSISREEFLMKVKNSVAKNMIEEQSGISTFWQNQRVSQLKEIEVIKHDLTVTPRSKLNSQRVHRQMSAGINKITPFELPPTKNLPPIVANLIKKPGAGHRKARSTLVSAERTYISSFFTTELADMSTNYGLQSSKLASVLDVSKIAKKCT